jgi:hypothetical protein
VPPAASDHQTSTPAQDSVPPSESGEQTSTQPELAQPPLSGVQLQRNEDQVKPRGLLIPALMFSGTETLNGGRDWKSAISGYLDYSRNSARGAVNLHYGGGLFGGADPVRNSSFHNLSVSESFALRRWTFTLGDILSYLPQAPVGGGIGIPGLGQNTPGLTIGDLNPNLIPSQSILTFNTTSINDSSYGQMQYNFTRRTSITAVGSYGLLRYPDDSILDGHQMVFSTGLNHDFGRSQTAVQYSYSRFGYDSLDVTTEVHSAQLMYSRLLARNFSAQVSIGPEIIHATGSSRAVDSGLAAIVYNDRRNQATLQYVRGINGGSGLLRGANSNTIELSADHLYRLWTISFNGAYITNSGVTQNIKSIARSVGAQLTRSFSQTISGYLNYTYLAQSSGALCIENVCGFNGDENVIGVGLSWQMRGLRIGK